MLDDMLPAPEPAKPSLWRVAYSLQTILMQVNSTWPDRSKVSDGTIGDASHAARKSDHNPDLQGVVRARDITHDPASGADMELLTEAIRGSRDTRCSYMIFKGRIFSSYRSLGSSSADAGPAWAWRKYHLNPHAGHAHLSVVRNDLADDRTLWAMPEQETPNMHTVKDHANYHALGPNPWGDIPWAEYVAAGYTTNPASRTWEFRREDMAWVRVRLIEEIMGLVQAELVKFRKVIDAENVAMMREVDRRIAAAIPDSVNMGALAVAVTNEITRRTANG
jgi:hypothetical protein